MLPLQPQLRPLPEPCSRQEVWATALRSPPQREYAITIARLSGGDRVTEDHKGVATQGEKMNENDQAPDE